MEDTLELWNQAKNGIFTDFVITEKDSFGGERDYPVHKIVIYTKIPYVAKRLDSGFGDAKQNILNIYNFSDSCGLLEVVLEAVYAPNRKKILGVYHDFVRANKEESIDRFIALYSLCDFLLLDTHLEYLIDVFNTYIDPRKFVEWELLETKRDIPQGLEEISKRYYAKSVKVIKGESYIALEMLILMTTGSNSDDMIKLRQKLISIQPPEKIQ